MRKEEGRIATDEKGEKKQKTETENWGNRKLGKGKTWRRAEFIVYPEFIEGKGIIDLIK